jgi:DNA-directed RNA polymerase specialized sigma24 family protein
VDLGRAADRRGARELTRDEAIEMLDAPLALAVRDLDSRFRDVLLGAAWDGLSYREIAETQRCSLGTVMSRLHRARVRVSGRLGVRYFRRGRGTERRRRGAGREGAA